MAEASRNPNRMSIDGDGPGGGASKPPESGESKTSVTPLTKMIEKRLLDELGTSLTKTAQLGTFACGGHVPVKSSTSDGSENATPPVQLRFGADGNGKTLTFPGSDASSVKLQGLLDVCTPMTPSENAAKVLNPENAEAVEFGLDPTNFATTFCPYRANIIDIVAQLLLPQRCNDGSIRAELRKLNIHTGPNGKCTTRAGQQKGEHHLGELVVALPVIYSGGELAVRYSGREVTFDWSVSAKHEDTITHEATAIQWAAFYNECEREVCEVSSGYRVTLSYNLFVRHGQGHLAGRSPMLDPQYLPFFSTLKSALANPSFLGDGKY